MLSTNKMLNCIVNFFMSFQGKFYWRNKQIKISCSRRYLANQTVFKEFIKIHNHLKRNSAKFIHSSNNNNKTNSLLLLSLCLYYFFLFFMSFCFYLFICHSWQVLKCMQNCMNNDIRVSNVPQKKWLFRRI